MRFCVLTSGSKGNSTYVEIGDKKFLIDIGTTSLNIERKLKEIGVDPKKIDGILISHTHDDHVSGLRVFVKKYNPIVYLTAKMYDELKNDVKDYYIFDDAFNIDGINITPIKTSHDASDSWGFLIEKDYSLVYMTDTGYINVKNHKYMKNKNFYILESNHDVEMLLNGKYPYPLKQRILGDKGHLSNIDSANYLAQFIGSNTKAIVLAHLSEENNTKQLAYDTLKNTLKEKDIDFDNIIIASQEFETDVIEI